MDNGIHVLFETLNGERHLIKFDTSSDVEYTADEPAYIDFIRIIDGDWTITHDHNQTILDYKDTALRVHWMNDEPEYIVVKESANVDDVGEFNGSIMTLLNEYQIPMDQREWVGHSMTLLRVKMWLEPCKMKP
ncbi:hypothetical protein [Aeromonas rivipollensis]|uniref:hypothetical protein n=1 Tax=Aeromonas rivipollensis TaxID=948519 RepID=UPI0013D05883|nr:hypothetical protein [Aeromonas rivipollensis]NEX81744.1 hypothetical protein [Aeromonas rivipollensis]